MTKSMSRFVQIASSAPSAKSRQRLLERKADQILRRDGFFSRMSDEEKAIRQEAENFNLRAFHNSTHPGYGPARRFQPR